jgi:hypothetical protein
MGGEGDFEAGKRVQSADLHHDSLEAGKRVQSADPHPGPDQPSRTDGVSTQEVMFSIVAEQMARYDALTDLHRKLLVEWGYDPNIHIAHGAQSFVAMLVKPHAGSDQPPLLVFRGTDFTVLDDLLADLEPNIGMIKFTANRKLIAELLREAGAPAVLLGHSLGGALAQLTAAEFPWQVKHLYTFSSPGVAPKVAQASRVPATHHMNSQDIIPEFGEAKTPGEFVMH